MACFIVPLGLGIVTTALARFFPKRWNIQWLNAMLWGAVVMLAVEHVAHGEITPYPPFLTAGIMQVLPEMLSVGGPMALFSTGIWASLVVVNEFMSRRNILAGLSMHKSLGHV